MAIAFQVTEFQTILKQHNGAVLRSNARPAMSFDYEVLTYTETDKSRFWRGEKFDLTAEQITEVEAYVNSVEADTSLTQSMTEIHQAKSILAATDWYVVRKMETGKEIPANILQMRELARANINEAEGKL